MIDHQSTWLQSTRDFSYLRASAGGLGSNPEAFGPGEVLVRAGSRQLGHADAAVTARH